MHKSIAARRKLFFIRRECWKPTLVSWLIVIVFCIVCSSFFVMCIHPYLSPTHPKNAQVLIVEGWLPDAAMEKAAIEFKKHGYKYCISTGGPIECGYFLTGYKNFAQLGALTLRKLGIDSSLVYPVNADFVEKDRTFASALSVNAWLIKTSRMDSVFNLFSIGCHAKRSHLLFTKVLGKRCSIGIISCEDDSYDKKHWWRSSSGVRDVIGETIAYCYGVIFFLFKSS